MLKIDNSLLVEIGLGSLPENEKNSFLKHVYETLEMRVGVRLADQMTNQQLDEFEQYFEAKDDAGAFKWLEANFPNYKEIVQEEFDKLKAEVAQTAPQILAASQSAQLGQPEQPGQSAQPQPPQAPAQAYADAGVLQPQPQPQPQYQQQPRPAPAPPPQSVYQQSPPQPQYQPPQPSQPAPPTPQPYVDPNAPPQFQPTQTQPQPQPQYQQPQPQYPPQQPPAGPPQQ